MTSRQKKKDKSGYGASWRETPFEKLELPFSVEGLKEILTHGADETSRFSHQQIADWCFRFWWESETGFLSEILDDEADVAADIALDVDAQWDLYLGENFTLGELQSMDFSKVRLPAEWFRTWQQELSVRGIK